MAPRTIRRRCAVNPELNAYVTVAREPALAEMRTGVHDGLLQEAVAAAASVPPALVRRASLLVSDPSEVARLALVEGEAGLRAVGVRLFVPLLPMLAEPAEDLAAVLATHGGRTALEVKYDGARIQIHGRGTPCGSGVAG